MSLPLHHEVQALVRVRPVCEWFAHSFVPGPCCGYARFYQAEPAPVVGTTKCPESLCLMLALPSSGRRVPPPPRILLPVPRSYGLMRQSRVLSSTSAFGLVRGVFAGCYQPLLLPGLSRRYLCKSVPGCLVPYPDGPTECFYLFLPRCHRPSQDTL
jgi:hypothetical protein